jgi:hypothetical protein
MLSFHIRVMSKRDPRKFQGYVELARVLLEHGADVNAQDDEKHTMLYCIGMGMAQM